MLDSVPGVFLWASILGFKSMALVAVLLTAFMGPSLWKERQWWVWILPRQWQRVIAVQSDADFRRFWWKVRVFCWTVFFVLVASWIMMAYQVLNRD